ncbi:MAG: hypothetical protein JRD04_11715 [Deltaproteobacteria bacterium]|nr:hypothetical protein [Deltaproteobacteria bacterium]
MTEKSVVFESGDLKLEGLLDRAEGDAGVVITHPHPHTADPCKTMWWNRW